MSRRRAAGTAWPGSVAPRLWPIVTGMHKVTGIGGVFLRGRDAAALRAWYAEQLGIDVDASYGGAHFGWTPGGSTTWAVFPADTDYFGRRDQASMVNYRVDDLDGMLAQLRARGADVAEETEDMEGIGRFGWVTDPAGNRVELWQPA